MTSEESTLISSSQLRLKISKNGAKGVQMNSVYYCIMKPWNELPKVAIYTNNINVFKTKLGRVWTDLSIKF